MEKKLYRDDINKKIGGVCAGLAEYFGIDVSIIRVLFLATLILKGTGVVLYGILWIVLPRRPYIYNPEADYKVPPVQDPFNPFKSTTPPNFTMPNYGKPADPFGQVPVKKPSNVGAITGAILIIIGGAFLLENFDLIPDIDFDVLWPLILVGIGIAFILSGSKKKPWEKEDWSKPGTEPVEPVTPVEQTAAEEPKSEETKNDNPPTV